MPLRSNYDKFPVVRVTSDEGECAQGWAQIAGRIRSSIRPGKFVVCVECYPGCFEREIERELVDAVRPQLVIRAKDCYRSSKELNQLFERDLTDDPVFGRMNNYELSDFLDGSEIEQARQKITESTGLVLVWHRCLGHRRSMATSCLC